MIDVKHTTLMPSLRALTAFTVRGELDALMAEYSAERAVVAAAIGRPLEEVTVELAPAARAATARDLTKAPGAAAVRRRLVKIHAIHPQPFPVSTHRILDEHSVGVDRRDRDTWLWFAGPHAHDAIAAVLEDLRITATTPHVADWPVTDAIALGAKNSLKPLLRALAAVVPLVDVDHNGRPLP